MAINTYKFFQECVTTSTGPMQHELHISKALPHLYTQSEAKMLSLRRVVQQNQPEISFERWVDSSEDEGAPDVPDTAYPQVATMKHDEVHRLFPSKAEAVSLEEADSDADRHQSEADQALEKDGLVIPFPHEELHYFAMKLPNTFNADVVVIFSVASGALVKAVFLKHKYAVCFAPTLHAQEVAHAWLLTSKHGIVLQPGPTIPEPEKDDLWCTSGGLRVATNDGSKPDHGTPLYSHFSDCTIRYCYPCDLWFEATLWEYHLTGKKHWQNKDKKRDGKAGHHKFGKKPQKNENKKKKPQKNENKKK